MEGKHPAESRVIIEEARWKPKAVFIPMDVCINIHGRDVKITGGIKSTHPPHVEEVMSHGTHPFTCLNCTNQEYELKTPSNISWLVDCEEITII